MDLVLVASKWLGWRGAPTEFNDPVLQVGVAVCRCSMLLMLRGILVDTNEFDRDWRGNKKRPRMVERVAMIKKPILLGCPFAHQAFHVPMCAISDEKVDDGSGVKLTN